MDKKEQLRAIVKNLSSLPLTNIPSYLKTLDIQDVTIIKKTLDKYYYNEGKPLVSDNVYDVVKDFLIVKVPEESKVVGAPIRTSEGRIPLPYWLGSANKITPKDINQLMNWLIKNNSSSYIITEKLDGVSCLFVKKDNKITLYTRGDGYVGTDISHLYTSFQYMPNFNTFSKFKNIAIRGELIISKNDFDISFRNKIINGREYKNARNTVTGLIGSKSQRFGLNLIQFIAYEIVSDDMNESPELQLQKLKEIGFKTVKHEKVNDISISILENKLLQFKRESEFEIDGIIIQKNTFYMRNVEGNPSYMFAFKMLLEDGIARTTVLDIEWGISSHGKLTPVVLIQPVILDGVEIKRATAFHARYVEENKLGPGSIIEIVRSGQVIPHIHSIIKHSEVPKMPNIAYKWDANHVFIYKAEMDNSTCVKLISSFFSKIGVKQVADKTIEKLFDHGYDNLFKILDLKQNDIEVIPGFQFKSADNVVTHIKDALSNLTVTKLLGSSSVLGYGIGERKVEALFEAIPNILELYKGLSHPQLVNMIANINGFSYITAEKIVPNLVYADKFVQKIKKYTNLKEKRKSYGDMNDMKIVFSGFRDADLERKIEERGGKVSNAVSGLTTFVVVKVENSDDTTKTTSARKKGIPIINKMNFITKFGL